MLLVLWAVSGFVVHVVHIHVACRYVGETTAFVGVLVLAATVIWSVWRLVRNFRKMKENFLRSRLDNPRIREELVRRWVVQFLSQYLGLLASNT